MALNRQSLRRGARLCVVQIWAPPEVWPYNYSRSLAEFVLSGWGLFFELVDFRKPNLPARRLLIFLSLMRPRGLPPKTVRILIRQSLTE